ncbi:hypothetical protein DFH27DRAFT_574492 [Peziza echinospora]|nr:hypothetical protein DFH27DRAFT_574492 [Peziza echinospora]
MGWDVVYVCVYVFMCYGKCHDYDLQGNPFFFFFSKFNMALLFSYNYNYLSTHIYILYLLSFIFCLINGYQLIPSGA